MKREACPICGASEPFAIEHRVGIPVFLNRLEATRADALAAATGTLDLVGCVRCGFVWNRAFDAALVPYDANYENDQTHSRAFRQHAERMAAKIVAAAGDAACIDVVEVGCGQGVFLAALANLAGPRLRSAVGFDPAYRGGNVTADPRIRLFPEYFDERALSCLSVPATLVVTRHTLGQVGDPVAMLSAIRRGMAGAGAQLFIETPDVTWVVERREIQDLFYEHCSLFDPHTISIALQKAGFMPPRWSTYSAASICGWRPRLPMASARTWPIWAAPSISRRYRKTGKGSSTAGVGAWRERAVPQPFGVRVQKASCSVRSSIPTPAGFPAWWTSIRPNMTNSSQQRDTTSGHPKRCVRWAPRP
ncbi:MAG: class I SAM-dependent methyltransferase [Rhizomicrobium sp.]